MKKTRDSRSAHARAYSWASRVTAVSLEMVLPGLIGHMADRQFGTKAFFTISGFIGGMCLGMWHLLKIANQDSQSASSGKNDT